MNVYARAGVGDGVGVGAWVGVQSWLALWFAWAWVGLVWAVGCWLAGLAWTRGMGMGVREEDPVVAAVANLFF